MKKWFIMILSAAFILSLTACGNNKQNQAQPVIERPKQSEEQESKADTETADSAGTEKDEESENISDNNILIVYFTVPETDGVDAVASASRVVKGEDVLGNTQFIATEIQKNLGGDLFAIETTQDYPGTHDELLEFAYNEKSDNARPELATHIENLDNYDYIFIGYPNWNADLPMPLYSFFDEYDFSGKTIIPFVTHGGSGFSGTIQTIEELEPNATVIEAGLSISRNNVADAQADVKAWTDSLLKD